MRGSRVVVVAASVAVIALIWAGVALASTARTQSPVAAPSVGPAGTTSGVPGLGVAQPAAIAAAAAKAVDSAPVSGTPCRRTARACVDLSSNQAWLISAGVVAYGPVPITAGRPGFRTPPGTFRVGWKDIDHLSREFDLAPMPYSVFFNGGIAFHEGSLRVLSHGCIHLSRAAAQTFFSTLRVGDVVQVAA
ncbi:L,D-transpeptidase [Pseudonocardia xishanensis]|uniref:L,D-TPase catalytic domain-containing protein n=1 Tax=Pseudonocardia xishanensis TaxID=630995 RepID=A0ABP8S338_9PSEU